MSLSASEMHLKTQVDELRRRYDTLTKRIAALDTDIGRELDSERKLTLSERRADALAERDQIAADVARIEQQLVEISATSTPYSSQADAHVATDILPRPSMAKLNGKQVAQLQQAILDAFEYNELRQFLLTRLDRYLSHISLGSDLTAVVFDVITNAEREGWTENLLDAVANERPNRGDVQDLCRILRAVVQSREP